MPNGCEFVSVRATEILLHDEILRLLEQANKFNAKDLDQRVAALEARVQDFPEKK